MKIKLFTHTDLDGVGCAILLKKIYSKPRIDLDIEYCGYDNIDVRVESILNDNSYKDYSFIFITDISVSKSIAEKIDARKTESNFALIDHHATALYLNKYTWASVKEREFDGVLTCGTELLFNLLCKPLCAPDEINTIRDFVDMVRDYDTWRWKNLYDGSSYGSNCKKLNDLFYIYGRDNFIEWVLKRFEPGFACGEFPAFSSFDDFALNNLQKEIDRYIDQKDREIFELIDSVATSTNIISRPYGVVFADRYISELGSELSKRHPDLHYIMIINIGAGVVSYRTTRDNIHLGHDIAHSFGGGGHAQAAGSTFYTCDVIEGNIRELNNQRPVPSDPYL